MMLGVNIRVFLLSKAAGTRPWRLLWDVSHPSFLGVLCACSQAGGNSGTSSLGASDQGGVHHIHQEGDRIWGSGLSHTHHAGFEARPRWPSEGGDPAPAVQLGLPGGWAGGACSWFHGLRINREARAVKAGPPSASWMSPSPELLLCLSHVSLRTEGMAHACLHRTCVQKCTQVMPVGLTFGGICTEFFKVGTDTVRFTSFL